MLFFAVISSAVRRAAAVARHGALAWALLIPMGAMAQTPLQLEPGALRAEAWPAITILSDATQRASAHDVLGRLAEFKAPQSPYANLGPRRDAVWLQLQVVLAPEDSGEWMLDIDYPALDRIDVYEVIAGQPVHLGTMGDTVEAAQRPLATRSHTMPLPLRPGLPHMLLLRVATTSAMVLPLQLVRPHAWQAAEARVQMLQGLMAGLGLCLVLYSLAQWVSLRDPMFLEYAAMVLCTSTFFFALHGLAAQHLWPASPWLVSNAPVLAVTLALGAGFLFIERALGISALSQVLGRTMKFGAAVAFATAAAFVAGWIDFRIIQGVASVMGPLTIVMGAHAATVRSRAGDAAARCILVAWGSYAVGAFIGVGLLRGLVPSNVWTQHALQFGSMVESIGFMAVLGVRMEQTRLGAQRAHAESDALRLMAHSDPLTGLRNRRGLSEALQASLATCPSGQLVAVYLLDLDAFKQINDRLGHDAGDELLVGIAGRLRATVRPQDIVARLGGDEFVVAAAGLPGPAQAQALGQQLLEAFRQPFTVAGAPCRMGLTIGYALGPTDGRDASLLLRQADAAMYIGKQTGRNRLCRAETIADRIAA